jgi:hypothetical protein
MTIPRTSFWRASSAALTVCLLLLVGITTAGAQLPSTLTTPTSRALNQLRDSSMRPIPTAPPAPIARPDSTWVPDRFVTVPGIPSQVHIPAHWERRLLDGESYVPPLTGLTTDGRVIQFPAGSYPPVDHRLEP